MSKKYKLADFSNRSIFFHNMQLESFLYTSANFLGLKSLNNNYGQASSLKTATKTSFLPCTNTRLTLRNMGKYPEVFGRQGEFPMAKIEFRMQLLLIITRSMQSMFGASERLLYLLEIVL